MVTSLPAIGIDVALCAGPRSQPAHSPSRRPPAASPRTARGPRHQRGPAGRAADRDYCAARYTRRPNRAEEADLAADHGSGSEQEHGRRRFSAPASSTGALAVQFTKVSAVRSAANAGRWRVVMRQELVSPRSRGPRAADVAGEDPPPHRCLVRTDRDQQDDFESA
jgi:hypothetical protein